MLYYYDLSGFRQGEGKAIASFSQDVHVLVRGKWLLSPVHGARRHLKPAQTLPTPCLCPGKFNSNAANNIRNYHDLENWLGVTEIILE